VARRWFSQELKGLIEAKLAELQVVVSTPAPTILPLPEALNHAGLNCQASVRWCIQCT
jgi:hypothetical protein